MRVDRSLQKKTKKTTNQHASHIPHIGKGGTPCYNSTLHTIWVNHSMCCMREMRVNLMRDQVEIFCFTFRTDM